MKVNFKYLRIPIIRKINIQINFYVLFQHGLYILFIPFGMHIHTYYALPNLNQWQIDT